MSKVFKGKYDWFSADEHNNKLYYYKFYQNQQLEGREYFMSKILEKLPVKSCKIEDYNHSLIESFIDNSVDDFFSYSDILVDLKTGHFYDFTPNEVIDNLNKFCKKYTNYYFDEKELITDLNKMAIIDLFFINTDRHSKNFMFLCKKNNGKLKIELAPLFDNEYCFDAFPTQHSYYRNCYDYYVFGYCSRDGEESKQILKPSLIIDNNSHMLPLPDIRYIDKSLLNSLYTLDIAKEYLQFNKETGIEIEDFDNFIIYFNNLKDFFDKLSKNNIKNIENDDCLTL